MYLAEQKSLGRQVVLKILDSKVRDTPETIERFLNEGRIIALLNHPHIITIFDIGQSEQDVYISMEYVEGGDLRQRMQHKVFAPVEAIDVIEKIAGGLALAHAQDIIHREVKLGNILFRDDGTPLLSDFGIAKRLSSDADLTSTGMFLGSPNYMAPEQSEAGPIDGRADIYSLGIITGCRYPQCPGAVAVRSGCSDSRRSDPGRRCLALAGAPQYRRIAPDDAGER